MTDRFEYTTLVVETYKMTSLNEYARAGWRVVTIIPQTDNNYYPYYLLERQVPA